MKKFDSVCLLVLMTFFVSANIKAQTQTVTLTASNGSDTSYSFSTNQIITINSFIIGSGGVGYANILFTDGRGLRINPYTYGSSGSNSFTGSAVFTGVTSIYITSTSSPTAALTFTITTPAIQSSIPANAVVIPTDATGSVEIVLESSGDLVNWTSSLPGTYGNTYSNRFFRVRAIAQ